MELKLIADNDPGGTLSDAFDTMAAETVETTSENMVSDIDMAAKLGLGTANAILTALQSAIDAAVLPARVMRWLESSGIDVNHPETQAILDSLVPTYLSTGQVAALKALGNTPKYPGLTIGQLDKARRLRAEGKV